MNRSPMNGQSPPFTLPSGMVYFLDWRYVDHGLMRWRDGNNQNIFWKNAESAREIHGSTDQLPRNIRIQTIPGRVDEQAVLHARDMDEVLFFCGSVVQDQGMYRLFYESVPKYVMAPQYKWALGMLKVLRYAESADGLRWNFPRQNRFEVNGSKDNNVVLDPGKLGMQGTCVFRDPAGSASERYKAMFMGYVSRETFERYREKWPTDIDPKTPTSDAVRQASGGYCTGMLGAVSPDGLHWTMLEEPLLIHYSDTFNACAWDPLFEEYVFYPRTWYYARRAVGRAVSKDFRHFTDLQQVLWPGPEMRPTDTWYTPGATVVPGAPDYRLLFATLWSQLDDTFSPILHSSADGILWERVPGPAMMPHGPLGSWHHCGGAVSTLVELPGDQWGSLFKGWHVPHKYPRSLPGFGQAGWIRWPKGRLAAISSEGEGSFSLFRLADPGRQIRLNYRTRRGGWIRVAVHGQETRRTLAECDWIEGDQLDQVVTWKGQPDMGHQTGEPVKLQFELCNAELFSVSFK